MDSKLKFFCLRHSLKRLHSLEWDMSRFESEIFDLWKRCKGIFLLFSIWFEGFLVLHRSGFLNGIEFKNGKLFQFVCFQLNRMENFSLSPVIRLMKYFFFYERKSLSIQFLEYEFSFPNFRLLCRSEVNNFLAGNETLHFMNFSSFSISYRVGLV